MVLFFHAARLALVVFDPYLSSRPLAEALLSAPPGKLIVDRHYYYFSSVIFYTGQDPLLLNGKFNNLEYGAAAPGAPAIFLTDSDFKDLWTSQNRYYLVASEQGAERIETLVGKERFETVATSGGKLLLTNLPPKRSSSARRLRPANLLHPYFLRRPLEMTFTTEGESKYIRQEFWASEALRRVRRWKVLVSLLGLPVYLIGMHRSVYPY
jgi:hypothetical protein